MFSKRSLTGIDQRNIPCDEQPSDCPPSRNLRGGTQAGLYLLRRAGGSPRLLSRRVCAPPTLALGSGLRRFGGALPVSARPGQQPIGIFHRAAAGRSAWGFAGLAGIYVAFRRGDDALWLRGRGHRRCQPCGLAQGDQTRRRRGGGPSRMGHGNQALSRPDARLGRTRRGGPRPRFLDEPLGTGGRADGWRAVWTGFSAGGPNRAKPRARRCAVGAGSRTQGGVRCLGPIFHPAPWSPAGAVRHGKLHAGGFR